MRRSVCNALAGTSLIGLLAATLAACIPTQRTAQAAPSGAAPSSADSTAAACARLPDLPSPPADALDVTGFGARPDDDQPDDEGIARALAALKPGGWLLFPPGRYLQARSWYVTTRGVTVWGAGATIHALNPADLTLGLRADGVRLYGLTLTAAPGRRQTEIPGTRVSIGPGRHIREDSPPVRGNVVQGIQVIPPPGSEPTPGRPRGGASGGVFVMRAADFTIAENTILETLADGIHITGGSFNGRILANRVEGTGDDTIATVSYLGPKGMEALRRGERPAFNSQVHDILIQGNQSCCNSWGRGIGVIGSRRITIRGNTIREVRHAAGIIVAQEGSYLTPGASDVWIDGNLITDIQRPPTGGWPAGTPARTGHGAIEIHTFGNREEDLNNPFVAGQLSVRNISVTHNRIERSAADGIRVGVASLPGMVANVELVGNHISRSGGRPIELQLPGAVSRLCGLEDAGSPGCEIDRGPHTRGAQLNCSRLP